MRSEQALIDLFKKLPKDGFSLSQFELIQSDLFVLDLIYKALKEGIYFDDDGEIVFTKIVKLFYDYNIGFVLEIKNNIYISLSQYQTGWGFSEEEVYKYDTE